MNTRTERFRFFMGVCVVAVLLAACGGGEGTGDSTPLPVPETETPSPIPTVETTEAPSAPAEVPDATEGPPPSPLDAILEVLLTRAADKDVVAGTLYQLMSVPVVGGESVVFHYEDAFGAVNVGCTGHALVLLADGGLYEVQGISVSCGSTVASAPITIFTSEGISANGEAVTIVYGEIYDARVVAIRLFWDGGETNALISGGGYHAEVPLFTTAITARAYDADGELVHEGVPQSQ